MLGDLLASAQLGTAAWLVGTARAFDSAGNSLCDPAAPGGSGGGGCPAVGPAANATGGASTFAAEAGGGGGLGTVVISVVAVLVPVGLVALGLARGPRALRGRLAHMWACWGGKAGKGLAGGRRSRPRPSAAQPAPLKLHLDAVDAHATGATGQEVEDAPAVPAAPPATGRKSAGDLLAESIGAALADRTPAPFWTVQPIGNAWPDAVPGGPRDARRARAGGEAEEAAAPPHWPAGAVPRIPPSLALQLRQQAAAAAASAAAGSPAGPRRGSALSVVQPVGSPIGRALHPRSAGTLPPQTVTAGEPPPSGALAAKAAGPDGQEGPGGGTSSAANGGGQPPSEPLPSPQRARQRSQRSSTPLEHLLGRSLATARTGDSLPSLRLPDQLPAADRENPGLAPPGRAARPVFGPSAALPRASAGKLQRAEVPSNSNRAAAGRGPPREPVELAGGNLRVVAFSDLVLKTSLRQSAVAHSDGASGLAGEVGL